MTWDYEAPLQDMGFALREVLRAPDSWQQCPTWQGLDSDTVEMVLQEAARFSREQLLPLNRRGDQQGCRRTEAGEVFTPEGFRQAYEAFVEGGWPALPCSSEFGGQGLPLSLIHI